MKYRSRIPDRLIVGVDPARAGSVVCLSSIGRKVSLVFACAWKQVTRQRKRVFKIDFYTAHDDQSWSVIVYHPSRISREVTSELHNYSAFIGVGIEDLNWTIGVEDAYVGKSAKTGLSVARFGGQISGVIEAFLDVASLWVRASSWRAPVLSLPHFTKREEAKRASLMGIPPKIDGMGRALELLGSLDHITDAGGVALWAMSQKDQNRS